MRKTFVVERTASNESSQWSQSNHASLLEHLTRIQQLLQAHLSPADQPSAAEQQPTDLPEEPEVPAEGNESALDILCQLFHLSPFERDLLLLCAGVELEANIAALCATLQGNPQRDFPTFALALATLPDAHWSALTPEAPLRRWQLLQVEAGRSLTRSPLRIDERVLHFLVGIDYLDAQLSGLLQPLSPLRIMAPSHLERADEIAATWITALEGKDLPVIQLCGTERESIQAIAASACAQLQLNLYRISLLSLPSLPAEMEQLLRLWQREAILSDSVLLIDCEEVERSDSSREATLAHWIEGSVRGPLFIASAERRGPWQRPTLAIDVARPTHQEQRQLWESLLRNQVNIPANGALYHQIERLAAQFSLNLPVIVAATQGAQGRLASHNGSAQAAAPITAQAFGNALWDICRSQARPQLSELAQPIEALASWEDLVLPEREVSVLREIAMHVRQRDRVCENWGFASRGKRGLGISALFAGSSGTGKTMAAEVLAHELQLDLYRIDLSAVVSKYIGETEKNLRRVFDAAEAGGAILLFDEADALFGKRSDVKDSHDRYANIEVSYLLQRMEAYRGLAILTTNIKDAIDSAFVRRIRFIVQFPFPDVEHRAAIWRQAFPAATPINGLDMEKLAHLNVAGGNIRNIAMHAAFLAADASDETQETPVNMSHLLTAARREYAKMERSLTEAEIRGWV